MFYVSGMNEGIFQHSHVETYTYLETYLEIEFNKKVKYNETHLVFDAYLENCLKNSKKKELRELLLLNINHGIYRYIKILMSHSYLTIKLKTN